MAKERSFINLYGEEKEGVCYEIDDGVCLYTYPINTGFHFEIVSQNGISDEAIPELWLDMTEELKNLCTDEYVAFDSRNKILLVNAPMLFDNQKSQLKLDAKWNVTTEEKQVVLNAEDLEGEYLGEVHTAFSIQLHGEDAPDTTIYEKRDKNVYLSDRAVVGKNDIVGRGMHYLRYRINYFCEIKNESIQEAKYYIKNLNYQSSTPTIDMYYPLDQWSSTQMVWSTRIDYEEKRQNDVCKYESQGWISMDLTEYVRQAVQDRHG